MRKERYSPTGAAGLPTAVPAGEMILHHLNPQLDARAGLAALAGTVQGAASLPTQALPAAAHLDPLSQAAAHRGHRLTGVHHAAALTAQRVAPGTELQDDIVPRQPRQNIEAAGDVAITGRVVDHRAARSDDDVTLSHGHGLSRLDERGMALEHPQALGDALAPPGFGGVDTHPAVHTVAVRRHFARSPLPRFQGAGRLSNADEQLAWRAVQALYQVAHLLKGIGPRPYDQLKATRLHRLSVAQKGLHDAGQLRGRTLGQIEDFDAGFAVRTHAAQQQPKEGEQGPAKHAGVAYAHSAQMCSRRSSVSGWLRFHMSSNCLSSSRQRPPARKHASPSYRPGIDLWM